VQQQIKETKIGSLKPHPENPRLGDIDKIVQSIRANGFYGALIVQRSTNFILAGNHRWQAAKRVGLETVPCIFVDADDALARKILLSDNRTSDFGTYDTDNLTNLLKQVMSEDSLLGTGFDVADLQKLLGDVVDEPNDKRKRNLEPFHNSYWLVKAPISSQGAVTEKLSVALSGLDGVEIVSATN